MDKIPPTHTPNPAEHDAELDPRLALSIATTGQLTISRREQQASRFSLLIWSAAWLVSYSAMAAAYVFDALSPSVAGIIFPVAMVIAVVFTFVVNIRAAAGRRGPGARQGATYGIMWALAITVITIVSARLEAYVEDPFVLGWLANSIAVFAVGIMLAMGGVLFTDRSMLGFGLGVILALIISLILGPALFTLVFVAASCAGLVVSIALLVRGRSQERPA